MKMASAFEMVLNATLSTPNFNSTAAPALMPKSPFYIEPLWSVIIRWCIASAIFLVGE